jgi:hypothetical protein
VNVDTSVATTIEYNYMSNLEYAALNTVNLLYAETIDLSYNRANAEKNTCDVPRDNF